jgi:hypothetical protein
MKQTDYEQQAFSPDVFGRRNGIGRTTVFEEIKSGRLDARKVGRRTIITRQAEKAWQDSLPTASPRMATAAEANATS